MKRTLPIERLHLGTLLFLIAFGSFLSLLAFILWTQRTKYYRCPKCNAPGRFRMNSDNDIMCLKCGQAIDLFDTEDPKDGPEP